MWGGTPGEIVKNGWALAWVSTLVGCAAAGRRDLAPVPPVTDIPVAPAGAVAPGAVCEPLAPLPAPPAATDTDAASPSSAPSEEAAGAASADSPSPPPGALVSIVDEPPARFHVDTNAAPSPEHRHAKRHGHRHRPYHPAPGIIVDVVEAQGGTSAAGMQRIARNSGYWPFRHCYEEGLRRDQRLTGKVPLEVLVGSSGTVERVTVAAPTLGDASVVTCVAREALHLPLVAAAAPAKAKMIVTLALGDEPVALAPPVPGAEEIRTTLHESWPAIEQCYADELSKHPDAGGRMELRFRVAPTGEVVDVSEGVPAFDDADLTRCVISVYGRAQLPAAPREGTFVYALHFEPRASVLPVQ
jgi:hypothetical protein